MVPKKRSVIDNELVELRKNIVRLADIVVAAVTGATNALAAGDISLAQRVTGGNQAVTDLRYQIESMCLRILANRQPIAHDLRLVLSMVQVATELERIAEHAAGIARLVMYLENEITGHTLEKLGPVMKKVTHMIKESVAAYLQQDTALARTLLARHSSADEPYLGIFDTLIPGMIDESYARGAAYLLWIAHELEHIDRRVTAIAERVIFINGERLAGGASSAP